MKKKTNSSTTIIPSATLSNTETPTTSITQNQPKTGTGAITADSVDNEHIPQRTDNDKKGVFGNLSVLREALREESQKIKKQQAEASIDRVSEIWNNYTESCTSNSIKTALNGAILAFENDLVTVTVPTLVSKEIISQESQLIDELRAKLGMPSLRFDYIIDKDKFPDFVEAKPVQAMTQKEKLAIMVTNNPEISTFVSTLGLKIDGNF